MNWLQFSAFPLWMNLTIFAGAAICVWLAGTRLAEYADALGVRTGLSHAFLEMGLFFFADLCYSAGPILAATDRSAFFAGALAMIVTCIFLLGMLERRDRTVLGMGIDSLLVLIIYVAGLGGLYYLR